MARSAPRHDRTAIDPTVMLGKPVIRGTRVTVEQVLRELGAGMGVEEVLAAHPRLMAEDVRAAQAFAADRLAEETVAPADAIPDQALLEDRLELVRGMAALRKRLRGRYADDPLAEPREDRGRPC